MRFYIYQFGHRRYSFFISLKRKLRFIATKRLPFGDYFDDFHELIIDFARRDRDAKRYRRTAQSGAHAQFHRPCLISIFEDDGRRRLL